ncbi:hypothetical protein MVI01_66270 [Myxococcus virescens]|uniref:Uncharacterized protein n=1 Tax=Myxococcus virescens TaxID=83456 RepID=A0A511HMN1_9BACT|nr:hypothetical protein MVI01_66270 [Myxococcus virescens]
MGARGTWAMGRRSMKRAPGPTGGASTVSSPPWARANLADLGGQATGVAWAVRWAVPWRDDNPGCRGNIRGVMLMGAVAAR